jgi:hypothetical protein
MEPDFVEECLSVLTRTPATLDALLGDLPDAWTAATEAPEHGVPSSSLAI